MTIRQDVRSIEEFPATEAADRALRLIGLQNPFPKRSLMKSPQRHHGHVGTTGFRRHWLVPGSRYEGALWCIDGDREAESFGFVPNHIDWPRCNILARNDSVEVDERTSALHRTT